MSNKMTLAALLAASLAGSGCGGGPSEEDTRKREEAERRAAEAQQRAEKAEGENKTLLEKIATFGGVDAEVAKVKAAYDEKLAALESAKNDAQARLADAEARVKLAAQEAQAKVQLAEAKLRAEYGERLQQGEQAVATVRTEYDGKVATLTSERNAAMAQVEQLRVDASNMQRQIADLNSTILRLEQTIKLMKLGGAK